jgi:hypothetical protein
MESAALTTLGFPAVFHQMTHILALGADYRFFFSASLLVTHWIF